MLLVFRSIQYYHYMSSFVDVNVYYVMGFRPFRPNYFTCTAHLYLYCTLLVTHTYASYIRHWCIFSHEEIQYNLLVFLTCYQSHCSNPLVCRSSTVLSSWVSSAAVVVSSTTTSTATSVHQRPLPCRHHRFHFSDQTTDYTIGKKSLRSPFLWNLVFIGPPTRPHAPLEVSASESHTSNFLHVPPHASTRRHAPVFPYWRLP